MFCCVVCRLQGFNSWIDKCVAASPQPGICLFPEGEACGCCLVPTSIAPAMYMHAATLVAWLSQLALAHQSSSVLCGLMLCVFVQATAAGCRTRCL